MEQHSREVAATSPVTKGPEACLAFEAMQREEKTQDHEHSHQARLERASAVADRSIDPGETGEASSSPTADPLLRTLYLLEPSARLERAGDALVVKIDERRSTRIPAARLHLIMAFGATTLSSGAIALCLEQRIPVVLLSGHGRYFGLMDPIRIDGVDVQRAQFRALDNDAMGLCIARGFVVGKVSNSLAVLRRWTRRHTLDSAHLIIKELTTAVRAAEKASSLAELRGVEGAAAAAYWKGIRQLVPDEWRFRGRRRRPPPDAVNSMLSYGYTVLYYNVLALLVGRGLHPHAGFLHAARGGHHALVSDAMEEFRAPVVDALVLDLVLNRRLRTEDFAWPAADGQPCLMSANARRTFIHGIEQRLNAQLRHPRLGVVLDYRRIIDGQVLQLVSTIRGETSRYLPFVLKP
jgi:CRISPR-associated protein Cas1